MKLNISSDFMFMFIFKVISAIFSMTFWVKEYLFKVPKPFVYIYTCIMKACEFLMIVYFQFLIQKIFSFRKYYNDSVSYLAIVT